MKSILSKKEKKTSIILRHLFFFLKIKQEKMLNFVDIVRRVRTCGQLIKEEDILLLLHGLLSESESVQLLLLQKTATFYVGGQIDPRKQNLPNMTAI